MLKPVWGTSPLPTGFNPLVQPYLKRKLGAPTHSLRTQWMSIRRKNPDSNTFLMLTAQASALQHPGQWVLTASENSTLNDLIRSLDYSLL